MDQHGHVPGRGMHWRGRLPTIAGLWEAWSHADRFGKDESFASEVHRCVAGLVAAHRRWELAGTGSDHPTGDAVSAEAEVFVLMQVLDDMVTAWLGEPADGIGEHEEGFGAVMNRLASRYVAAWPASGAWGTADSRFEFGRECGRYTELIEEIASGRRRFPRSEGGGRHRPKSRAAAEPPPNQRKSRAALRPMAGRCRVPSEVPAGRTRRRSHRRAALSSGRRYRAGQSGSSVRSGPRRWLAVAGQAVSLVRGHRPAAARRRRCQPDGRAARRRSWGIPGPFVWRVRLERSLGTADGLGGPPGADAIC